MGQLLSQPVTDKTIEFHNKHSLSYAMGSMQGYRNSMEDAHKVIFSDEERLAVFGVFDGHGGQHTAQYVSDHLIHMMSKRMENFMNQNHYFANWRNGRLNGTGDKFELDFVRIIKNCFFKVDYQLYMENLSSGSTAIVVSLVNHNTLLVANTGDSRCILSSGGAAKNLSFDHKPNHIGELFRIRSSGGSISNGRIHGILALSRAFGDFNFKIPYNDRQKLIPPECYRVTVEPEFINHRINSEDEFLILACDGIWDCYKNKDLIDLIRHNLVLGLKLEEIVEIVLDNCINMADSSTGIGFDNMTIIIIALHNGFGMEEWYSKMKDKILHEKNLV